MPRRQHSFSSSIVIPSSCLVTIDRSVDSTPLRRALEQIYTPFLPKGGHPFIYISLLIDPQRVDVNIHPTKSEVGFLNEEEVIEKVCAALQKRLGEGDTSRRFTVQTLLPGAKPIEAAVAEDKGIPSKRIHFFREKAVQ